MNMKTIKVEKDIDTFFGHIIYFPEDQTKDIPLLVYLHGAGERGINLEHLERHGIPQVMKTGREIDAVILCPQCPAGYVWNNVVRELKMLIDKIADIYQIMKDRICLTGSSMGGYGTWEMGLTYPNYFSAIGPVCGGGMAWRSVVLAKTPVYTVHGDRDEVVLPVNSEMMIEQIKNANGHVKYLLLTGYGHNDGIYEAYNHTDLIDWLLVQRRTDFSIVPDVCSEYF